MKQPPIRSRLRAWRPSVPVAPITSMLVPFTGVPDIVVAINYVAGVRR